jgi:hypothetical protein
LAACTVLQQNIFCYGGIDNSNNPIGDTWSLDVSVRFSLSMAFWNNVSHTNDFITTPTFAGVILPLADGVSFLLNGGETSPRNMSEANQTTVFNTESRTWSTLNIENITQARGRSAVVDSFGKFWFWGGSRYCTDKHSKQYRIPIDTIICLQRPFDWLHQFDILQCFQYLESCGRLKYLLS